ncbi:hypothetical protein NGC49_02080 [Enterobacter vonholyi]|uniref:hypothetical protein n=1 Tax=Enterobacter vonholyi TaxID=2797505 RepID=UPI002DBFA071|nr:hypothetical protein [Enterobacter vonholyi]MEB7622512.1 hypothetical protein [Enterobacter vonholyi]
MDKAPIISKTISVTVLTITLVAGSQVVLLKNNIDKSFSLNIGNSRSSTELLESKYKEQIKQINDYRNETIQLTNMIEGLKNTSTLSSENIRIETLESKFNTLQEKLNSLENILNNSPEKAMALPLMRKDIDSLEKTIKASSEYSDKQLERFINLFYWICGTLALGIVGLCVGLFINAKKS